MVLSLLFGRCCERLNRMNHYCILVGAILGLSAVLAGAGGAHLLEDL
ncbi:MAG: hypothetical protein Ct9H300mP27_05620 [Chloroflexota bacterium]|nr:MAG: hypothetical protein Ct9H300mP27_05620 [Chloroflexota bacterium]